MYKFDINRLKDVLMEKERSVRLIAKQIDRELTTISKRCANKVHLELETIRTVADL